MSGAANPFDSLLQLPAAKMSRTMQHVSTNAGAPDGAFPLLSTHGPNVGPTLFFGGKEGQNLMDIQDNSSGRSDDNQVQPTTHTVHLRSVGANRLYTGVLLFSRDTREQLNAKQLNCDVVTLCELNYALEASARRVKRANESSGVFGVSFPPLNAPPKWQSPTAAMKSAQKSEHVDFATPQFDAFETALHNSLEDFLDPKNISATAGRAFSDTIQFIGAFHHGAADASGTRIKATVGWLRMMRLPNLFGDVLVGDKVGLVLKIVNGGKTRFYKNFYGADGAIEDVTATYEYLQLVPYVIRASGLVLTSMVASDNDDDVPDDAPQSDSFGTRVRYLKHYITDGEGRATSKVDTTKTHNMLRTRQRHVGVCIPLGTVCNVGKTPSADLRRMALRSPVAYAQCINAGYALDVLLGCGI